MGITSGFYQLQNASEFGVARLHPRPQPVKKLFCLKGGCKVWSLGLKDDPYSDIATALLFLFSECILQG